MRRGRAGNGRVDMCGDSGLGLDRGPGGHPRAVPLLVSL